MTHSNYYDLELAAEKVKKGRYRGFIGGLWDEVGALQFEYLRDHGLDPDMTLLDVGCGALRGGVQFVPYLDPGNYYGIDISQDLLDAGWEIELRKLGLQERLPRENLACTAEFEADEFGVQFDMALAQSLFTHLPANHIRLCLIRTADVVRPGGRFFATLFLVPEGEDWSRPLLHTPGERTTYPTKDPYHYTAADVASWIEGLPWRLEGVHDWDHPRDQRIAEFVRVG